MKILLSAFACDPTLGSEAYIGWSAVRALSTKHELWVIINYSSEAAVEAAVAKGEVSANVRFVYHGRSEEECNHHLLSPRHPNRMLAKLGNWRSYVTWNNALPHVAKKLHAEVGFDLIHHVTYGTWRIGSPLVSLGAPFVWGPIGGGEHLPLAFLPMLSPEGAAFELFRKVADLASNLSSAVRRTARASSHVFVANRETESRIIRLRGRNTGVSRLLAVYFSDDSVAKFSSDLELKAIAGPLRLFAGGMLEGRKGVALALRALSKIKSVGVPFEYVYGGNGPERRYLTRLAERLGLSGNVQFNDGIYGDAYVIKLRETHIYLMPSLRDSASVTLMQAMLAGCVPIVLNTGGPGEIVTEECGYKIEPISPSYVVREIERIIGELNKNRLKLKLLGNAASRRIREQYSIQNYQLCVENAYITARRKCE